MPDDVIVLDLYDPEASPDPPPNIRVHVHRNGEHRGTYLWDDETRRSVCTTGAWPLSDGVHRKSPIWPVVNAAYKELTNS